MNPAELESLPTVKAARKDDACQRAQAAKRLETRAAHPDWTDEQVEALVIRETAGLALTEAEQYEAIRGRMLIERANVKPVNSLAAMKGEFAK